MEPEHRHATAVSVLGCGVLLVGPSGAGKSDLALRLIDEGAELIADDRVTLENRDGTLWAAPLPGWGGVMEVRGMGLIRLAEMSSAAIAVVIELTEVAAIERLPDDPRISILGIDIPHWRIDPRTPSATAKVRLAVNRARGAILAYSEQTHAQHGD